MNNENNKMQVDIENLFKQNVNDLSAIKELYRKIQDMENKILQTKYIDSQLANKLKKEYEKLKKIILDENIQVKLTNDIERSKEETKNIQAKLTNDIETINSKMVDKTQQLENTKATKQEVEIERKRIDSLTSLSEGSTTGDAELIDGRIGADGVNYDNLGNAIRSQFTKLNEKIKCEFSIDYSNNIIKGKYISSTGKEVSLSEYNYVKMLNVHGLYSITLKNVATGGSASVVAYNENKVLIGKINTSNFTPSTETILLNDNIYYISISYSDTATLSIKGSGVNYITYDNQNKLKYLVGSVFEYSLSSPLKYKKINSNGQLVNTAYDYNVIEYIPIAPNAEITIENITSLNANNYCYAYYDNNFNFIQVGTDSYSEKATIKETTPLNAHYVSITYKNGNTPRVYTNDLSVYKNSEKYLNKNLKNTTVIWVDDDTNKTGIEYVYSACINKGVNATLACLPNKFTEDPKLKLRLLEMEEQGLEIVLHGYSHESDIWGNDNTDEKSVIADITKGFRELKDFQNYKHLVTPNGANSEMIKRVAKRFSPCLVSAWEGVNKKEWGDNSRYDLGRYWMTNHTLEEFKKVIDGLRPKNDLLILATHSAPSVAPWDAEKIESMLQYVKDKGYNIVTLSEGIEYFFN